MLTPRDIINCPQRKISLATLLSGLVALSVALTFTIQLIASYQSKKRALFDTTLTLNHSNAMKMSLTMDSLFKSMRGSLQYTAGIMANNPLMNEEIRYEHLELMRRSSGYFNSIVAVDETGIMRSIAPQTAGTAGKPLSTDASKEALALRKPYTSKPYISATGRLIMFMSEPLFDKDGTYRGLIGGTIYLQENNIMNTIFGSNNIDELGTYFFVVSSDGSLLFHPDRSRIAENVSRNQVVIKTMQGQNGSEQVVNTRGVALLAGYSTVQENNWGVVVVSPIDKVYEQLNRDIRTMLLYMLPPFVLLMLAAVWLARRLARPFVSLADLVSKLGKEKVDLPAPQSHWNREADLLTRTIMLAVADIRERTDQLTQAAVTDPLTGLANRRTMEKAMNGWIAEQAPFSIIVLDLDKFKSINDTYGHQVGDEVLKVLAETMKQSVRPIDICCRYGGEEFVILLARTSVPEAFIVAERIRRTMEESVEPVGKPVTLSLGIAHYPSHALAAEALFLQADQALYEAKRMGRNQTVITRSYEFSTE
ncbi:sensor domain-containing diguanylate cyclase [Paenibacillus contaminans]|uniref:Diguanylate cyclase n=1 Tax=Paenibacillus contaminans TaxID=450362 RepID=A0A329LPJ1_9BACL|nr:sensor domain-containing diguanylate cyclase [Paenibacillus contaminans]RAV09754.1 diguanylate cyclase [Paenibacillus contaminans]